MSGNTFTCRDRYFNYGSYLRSRGYDKEICNLIVAIEQGQFPIGPIYPGNCNSNPRKSTVINGDVDIVPCQVTDNTSLSNLSGQLSVQGGFIGAGGIDVSAGTNIPSLVAQQALGFGIKSYTGISSIGPIYQQTDCSHSNWFGAKNHVFVGGIGDCSTNVIVRGNLFVEGTTVELNDNIGETLSLITLPGNAALGTLNTFKSPVSNGNMVDMYAADLSSVSLLSGSNQWKNYLALAVDGNSNYPQTDVSGINASGGMSNVMGHMRGFRGLTITNPPFSGPVDIQWNPDISGTNRAIDAYGSIRVQPGNTDETGSNALGNIDISGGKFTIFHNDISNVVLFSNGDASFNGHVSCYDLSVSNLATIGTSTTTIDTNHIQANSGEFIDISVNKHTSVYDLSATNLVVEGDSEFTGNFLINNITGGSEAIQILTNGGTNENITIRNNQGDKDDSIIIKSTAGGVNISAGSFAPITFSAKDIIMSNSDLSANDISANNIQANNFILTGGNTFTDLSSNIDVLESSVNVLDISVNSLESSVNVLDISVNSLESSVNVLDASMSLVGKTAAYRGRRVNSAQNISGYTSPGVYNWTEIDLDTTDYIIGDISHSGSTEFKIVQKGLYSYNIQLSLTASGIPSSSFIVEKLELALTNGGSGPWTIVNPTGINNSGENIKGGFNKEFNEYYKTFNGGDKCVINGNGVGNFESGDLLRIYFRWTVNSGTHSFNTLDPNGTIVTMTLIQALE